jgi:HAD superfamily hydrolase (TIGR01450 family)
VSISALLTSFEELASNYKVILFDAYGVLKNSGGIIAGVPEVLVKMKQMGIESFVVTNDASKSPEAMARLYDHPTQGPMIPTERNISSGMLASDFLRAKVRTGRVAYLGKLESAYYIEEAGLEAVSIRDLHPEDEEVEALVLLDDEGFDWQADLNQCLNLLRRQNIPAVVANADPTYPVNSRDVAVAVGSLGDLMERLVNKRFIRFGKPDAFMFAYAYEQVLKVTPGVSKREILMVGDTLETDILGGNKFGIDTLLVLSGNTAAARAQMRIQTTGILPTYVSDSILT